MSVLVGTREIQRKEVFGTFRKYTYIGHSNKCPEGTECYVYCESDHDFIRLLHFWDGQVKHGYQGMGYRYSLTIDGLKGQAIALKDIPADNNFKVKVWLHCSNTGVSYIQ
jgi:hypothetical protein